MTNNLEGSPAAPLVTILNDCGFKESLNGSQDIKTIRAIDMKVANV